ncbi:MAG: hypothetical protein HY749_14530 [Gammaproteobacteria bacterium]|nr:hypothetical protein [Gammaproteobacteria bacterium]MBI5618455.1 hypothetical protein [Gammaproteobacteria bacterium]
MQTFSRASALFALLSALSLDAAAVTHMQVFGFVDSNGDYVPDSVKSDYEGTLPFPTPTIQVSDAKPGSFSYYAQADIATPALRISGSLTSGSDIANFETGVIKVYSEMTDTITLTSISPDPYDVTVLMQVDGTLDVAGAVDVPGLYNGGAAWLELQPNGGLGPSEFRSYRTSGAVSDVISETVQLSGNTQTLGIFTKILFQVWSMQAGTTVSGDFAHTAKLTLILPEGVTLNSSESGNFDTAPVPLPAGVLLFAPATLGLFGAARRRAV